MRVEGMRVEGIDERVPVYGVELHVRRWLGAGAGDRSSWCTACPPTLGCGRRGDRAGRRGAPGRRVDLRSHGESDAPDDGYDTATAAADVAAIAARVSTSPTRSSSGSRGVATWSSQVAAQHPEVAAALALVDGGWIDMRTASRPGRRARRRCARPTSTVARRTRCGPTSAPRIRDWSDWAIDATLANLAVAPDGTVTRRLSIPHHMQIVRSMWDDPPRRYYPDVHVPVLLDAGDIGSIRSAPPTSRDRPRAAAAALGNATIHEYRRRRPRHPRAAPGDSRRRLCLAASSPPTGRLMSAAPAGHHGLRRDRTDDGQAASGHLRARRRRWRRAPRYAVRVPDQRRRHHHARRSAISRRASAATCQIASWRSA